MQILQKLVLMLVCFVSLTSLFANPWKVLPASEQPAIKQVKRLVYLQQDKAYWADLWTKQPAQISIALPNPDPSKPELVLDLYRVELTKPGFKVTKSSKKPTNSSTGYCLQGHVRGESKSLAALTIFEEEIYGMVSTLQGNYTLGKINPSTYVFYNDRDLTKPHQFDCGTDESLPNYQDGMAKLRNMFTKPVQNRLKNKTTFNTCRTISIGLETDYALFQRYSNDTSAVKRFSISLFNLVQQLYLNEGVSLSLHSLLMWDTQDPYANFNSGEQLDSLRTIRGGVAGPELYHLLSGLDLNRTSAGGIAYLNAVCSPYNVGLSMVTNNLAPLPIYTWNSSVVAHELGHNFGSPHTHNCNWPIPGGGGLTAPIDSCSSPEGNCYVGPPIPRVGTIMSYCHLLGSIDLALGFGPMPGFVLRDTYANAPCLSGARAPFYSFISNSPVCSGSNLNVSIDSAGSGITWQWTGPNNFTATGASISISNVRQVNAGAYKLFGIINGCSTAVREVKVDVNCFPVADNSFNKSYCAGDSIKVLVKNIASITGSIDFYLEPTGLPLVQFMIGKGKTVQSGLELVGIAPNLAGQYYLLAKGPNNNTMSKVSQDSIHITSRLNAIDIDTATCDGTTVSINVPSPANQLVTWYDSTNLPLSTGSTFTTPTVTGKRKFFYSKRNQSTLNAGRDTSGGGNFRQRYTRGLLFRVLSPISLDSFTILTDGQGTFNYTIKRREYPTQTDIVYASAPINIPQADKYRIGANVTLQPGQYYIDAEGTSGMGLWRVMNGVKFPYTIPNVLSILTGSFLPDNNDVYFFFFDWKVTALGCESNRAEVLVQGINPGFKPTIVIRAPGQFYAGPSTTTLWYNYIDTNTVIARGSTYSGAILNGIQARLVAGSCTSAISYPYLLVGLNDKSKDQISLYPNPTSHSISISWREELQNKDVRLYDATGRLSATYHLQHSPQELDLSHLPKGIYTLMLNGQARRVVKE